MDPSLVTTAGNSKSTSQIVDHFFRYEYGRLISTFTSRYGLTEIEAIEDAVQDSMIKAMQIWPFKEIPNDPSAWIFRVANNRLIDKFRQAKKLDRSRTAEDVLSNQIEEIPFPEENTFEDDLLKMMFSCCHPGLPQETQIILTLNLLCGFGAHEIARALLKNKEAVAKALTRGKRRFKNEIGSLELPSEKKVKQRLQVVMKVIYLLFNEGYKVTRGNQLWDDSLTTEAIRLATILQKRYNEDSEIKALLAMMYFHGSRFKARTDNHGDLIAMEDQDRKLWNGEMIRLGNQHLEDSTGPYLTEYHIQAAIAAIHCNAATFADTDWEQILTLYDLYVSNNRLPMAELNRVVPFYKVKGPQAGLRELEKLKKYPKLFEQHLYHAIEAELLIELNRKEDAVVALQKALKRVTNDSERRFLEGKLEKLKVIH